MPSRLAISDLLSPLAMKLPDLGRFLLRRVRAPVRPAFLASVRDAGFDPLTEDVSLELSEDGECFGQRNEAHPELAQLLQARDQVGE